MQAIFIFGADGQLGLDLQKVFAETPLKKQLQIFPFTLQDLDVSDLKKLKLFLENAYEKLNGIPLRAIINCVALTNTSFCEDHLSESYAVNAFPLKVMGQFASEKKADVFHISTDYIFDGITNRPYREEDLAHPLSIYGASKLAAEDLLRAYHPQHFIFRSSSLFGIHGAQGKGGNFIETMLKLAKSKPSLQVVSDQVMAPTHTLDLARCLEFFIRQNIRDYGTYNFSNSGNCSWFQFTQEIFRQRGINTPLEAVSWRHFPSNLMRPSYSVLDLSKVRNFFTPPSWQEALKEYFSLQRSMEIQL